VCGLITSVCVQHTCCGAFSRGYEVELVHDCTGDRTIERHEQAMALYGGYMYGVTDTRVLKEELRYEGALGELAGHSPSSKEPRAPAATADARITVAPKGPLMPIATVAVRIAAAGLLLMAVSKLIRHTTSK
jgi:hypothetical protein